MDTTRTVGIGHIPESRLQAADKACTFCGFEGERAPELVLQRDPTVLLRHCPQCHASSAERMPMPEALAELYAPDVYTPHLSADDALTQRCARRLVSQLSLAPDADIEVLDYGGNDGSLSRATLKELRERGHRGALRATVVDLFPREAEEDLRFLHVDEFARSSDRYDVLLASAVLEHLPDMGAVTRRIAAAAKPGALFWARSPYDVPLARLPFGFPVLWPRHLHDLGPAFWARFLRTFGLSGRLLRSGPSLVQTSFRSAPLQTVAAHVLKAPARLERALWRRAPDSPELAWRWVGGWEVLARLDGSDSRSG